VPFLDNAIIDLSLRMPSRFKIHGRELKHLLKRALVGLLPPEILQREKRGFGAPMGAWLKGELAPLVRTVLSRDAVDRRGLLHWKPVEQAIALHFSNREDHTDHLIALMNLELWCRIYLDNRSPEDVAGELTESAG
jgi:asparagine synthase (glutamine-hydrolysing)